MRKKVLVSLLIAVSVTCFSGCGGSADQGNNTKEEVVTKKKLLQRRMQMKKMRMM